MKIFSNIIIWKLTLLSLLMNTQSKLVKRSSMDQFDIPKRTWVDVHNRGQRLLSDEPTKKISNEEFKEAISALIEKDIKDRYGEDSVTKNTIQMNVKNTATDSHMFSVALSIPEGDILQIEMVKVELILGSIEYSFMVEKTPLKGAPTSKCKLIMNNFFFLADQYISTIEDVLTDLTVALNMILVSPRLKKGGAEERILKEVTERRARTLKTIPIQSAVQIFPLKLNKKRYTSEKPEIQKNITRLSRELFEKKEQPARKLTGEGAPDVLTAQNTKFMHNKREIFTDSKLEHDGYNKLALVSAPVLSDTKEQITAVMAPSASEIGDVTMTVSVVNKGIQIIYEHVAVTIVYFLSIPSKRFVIKNVPNQVRDLRVILEIVFNLNNLRMWFDNGNDLYPRQRVIKELFQPTLIYLMYREYFDNKSDGITEARNGFDGSILKYKHSNSITDDNWWMEVYDMRPEPSQLFHDKISFSKYGEGFLVAHYETHNFYMGYDVKLGLRQFPDMSMFNQHFLAVRYIQMQVEFAVRVLNLKIFRDYVAPFPIQYLKYVGEDSIPIMQKKWWTMPQPKRIRELTDSPPVRNFNENIRLKSKLCPIASLDFKDSIRIHNSSKGGMSYSLSENGRTSMEWEVDYCTYEENIDSGAGGGEERRLADDGEEGFLV